ncbi:CKLF-like MARVEL transmembrane domain-containing protein 7 isoform X2 [Genypterus blacodes]|uniref:CKLF-like MARVEL transmembrane domain-containing protein 7 isoform X2 n=1 Tax=Genypterus blacodes TaxID=154954 RepID=UPI003F75CB49
MSHTAAPAGASPGRGALCPACSCSAARLLSGAQMGTLLIGFLCVDLSHSPYGGVALRYFEVVTLWFLVVVLLFFITHLFNLQSKATCINWPLTEFLHYAVGTVLIFIASVTVAVKSKGISELVAGSVFGFLSSLLLSLSLWWSYRGTCGFQQTGNIRDGSDATQMLPVHRLARRVYVQSGGGK